MATNTSSLHVFQILRLIADSTTPLGVAEVARRVELPTTTVYRALATLTEAGFIERAELGAKYRLGPTALLLSRAVFRRFPLREAAWPYLKRIATETGETASLAVKLGWYGVRIAAALGHKDIYAMARLGATRLLHRSRAMWPVLALLRPAELNAYRNFVRRHDIAAAREIDKAAIGKQLRNVAERGFAMIPSPLGEGWHISVPVCDGDGAPIAAIRINGSMLARMDDRIDARIKRCFAMRDALEAHLRVHPEAAANPFAHLAEDQIVLRTRADAPAT